VATTDTGTTQTSSQNQLAQGVGGSKGASNMAAIYSPNPNKATTPLAPAAIAVSGSGTPHENMMPYLSLNFCIALQGAFPKRG
jgi:microcystin-dependent protein